MENLSETGRIRATKKEFYAKKGIPLDKNIPQKENKVRCVTATHLNDEMEYTWSIPTCMDAIEAGDLLLVSTTVRDGISLVQATSIDFYISKEEHIENAHPYCAVLKNLGQEFNDEIREHNTQWEPVEIELEIELTEAQFEYILTKGKTGIGNYVDREYTRDWEKFYLRFEGSVQHFAKYADVIGSALLENEE